MKKTMKKVAEEELDKTETSSTEIKETEDKKESNAETVTESVTETADFVLSDGSVVEENVKLEDVEDKDLSKITKEDGTEIFVETPEEVSEEEKQQIYESIVVADSDFTKEVVETVNEEDEKDDEIEQVMYAPVAMPTIDASLNNSFYVFKLKSGKIKAIKAGNILSPKLKNIIARKLEANQAVPSETFIYKKIAAKIGNTFGAFKRAAARLVKAAMTPEGFATEKIDLGTPKKDLTLALGKKEETGLNVSNFGNNPTSNVHNLYNRLPSNSKVKEGLTVGLENPKESVNNRITTAAQIKQMRKDIKEKMALRASLEAANKEKLALEKKLQAAENFKNELARAGMIKKIVAAMGNETEEEKAVRVKMLKAYSDQSLKDIHEFITATPALDVDKMQEEELNEIMKKEASQLSAKIPNTFIKEASLENEDPMDLGKLLLDIELSKQQKFN